MRAGPAPGQNIAILREQQLGSTGLTLRPSRAKRLAMDPPDAEQDVRTRQATACVRLVLHTGHTSAPNGLMRPGTPLAATCSWAESHA